MKHRLLSCVLMCFCLWAIGAGAETLEKTLDQDNSIQMDVKKSQQKIDRISSETESLLREYQ